MTISRFTLLFLGLLPGLALAAPTPLEEASQIFRQGQPTQALDKINKYLNGNPKDAQGRFLKGLVLTDLNRYQDAIKVFSELTDDYPELPEPYNNLAVLYAAEGQYERAKNSLEMAIRTHPSYATAHENLGDIYAKMASQAYDKALQLDKTNLSAQTKLAMIKDLFGPPPDSKTAKSAAKTSTKPTGKTDTAATQASAKPTGKAETATAQATAKPSGKTEGPVAQAIQNWATAWSSKNVDAYLAAYAAAYAPDGMERAAWEVQRRERIGKPARIEVGIDELEVQQEGNRATASFKQHYRSDRYRDSTRKTLVLEQQGGAWKIVSEK